MRRIAGPTHQEPGNQGENLKLHEGAHKPRGCRRKGKNYLTYTQRHYQNGRGDYYWRGGGGGHTQELARRPRKKTGGGEKIKSKTPASGTCPPNTCYRVAQNHRTRSQQHANTLAPRETDSAHTALLNEDKKVSKNHLKPTKLGNNPETRGEGRGKHCSHSQRNSHMRTPPPPPQNQIKSKPEWEGGGDPPQIQQQAVHDTKINIQHAPACRTSAPGMNEG